jgi:hypothetical protein
MSANNKLPYIRTKYLIHNLYEPTMPSTRIAPEAVIASGTNDTYGAFYITTTFALTPTIKKRINNVWDTTSEAFRSIQNIAFVITYQQCPPPPPDDIPNKMGFCTDSRPHEGLIIFIELSYWTLPRTQSIFTTQAAE